MGAAEPPFGESLGLGPTQEVGVGGGGLGGWVYTQDKTKIVNTKAKSKNKSHHLGARLGLCSGQEEVGEGGSTQEDESKTKNFWSSTRPRP